MLRTVGIDVMSVERSLAQKVETSERPLVNVGWRVTEARLPRKCDPRSVMMRLQNIMCNTGGDDLPVCFLKSVVDDMTDESR